MFELTINDKEYKFNFGIGFAREAAKTAQVTMANGLKGDVGLEYLMSRVQTGDAVALVDALDLGNKYAPAPRISKKTLEAFVESDETDIDALFDTVVDFFSKSNATKKQMAAITEGIQEQAGSL